MSVAAYRAHRGGRGAVRRAAARERHRVRRQEGGAVAAPGGDGAGKAPGACSRSTARWRAASTTCSGPCRASTRRWAGCRSGPTRRCSSWSTGPTGAATVERIAEIVEGVDRGRPADATAALHDRLAALGDAPTDAALLDALRADYPRSAPDADLEAKLRAVDWADAKTAVYVGRLIAAKGPADLILALPLVAERHPEAVALVAGTGGLREGLEALAWALASGERRPRAPARPLGRRAGGRRRAGRRPALRRAGVPRRPRRAGHVRRLHRHGPARADAGRRSCSRASSTTTRSARSTAWPTRARSRRSSARRARSSCPRAPRRASCPSGPTWAAWATACGRWPRACPRPPVRS